MKPIRGVLFDWGDTLFSPPDAAEAIVAIARERGVVIDEESARAIWDGLWSAGKTEEELAKGRDLSAAAHRAVWTALFTQAEARVPGIADGLYRRVMDPRSWIPYPDTEPTLRALRELGIRIGIVSNVPRDLREIFALHRLDGFVDAFTHSYEVGAEKPDPRIFQMACERIGIPAAEALMVGDHEVADGGAVAAGLRFVLLGPYSGRGPRGLDAVVEMVGRSGSD